MPVATCAECQAVGVLERPDVTMWYKYECCAFGPPADDAGPSASWPLSRKTLRPESDQC